MLKQFAADLHSGKLHWDFHNEPEITSEHLERSEHDNNPTKEHSNADDNRIDVQIDESAPPESTFIKLAPSDKRYTLLRNEL